MKYYGRMLKNTQIGVPWKLEGHRPIEHSCKKKKKRGLKCRILIETNRPGEPNYRDENGNKYPHIKSLRNRTSLLEILIKEILEKRKWNIISPREERREIQVRMPNKQ